MLPFRTQVKLFLDNPASIDVGVFSGVFQRWIQDNVLDELIIDVADYRHVFEGPGIVLIGHASDYFIENRDGRLGLLYTRKRQTDANLQNQLQTAFRLALNAAELLQAESAFEPRLKFRADEVEIRLLDRLQFPNQPETLELVKDELNAVLAGLYGDKTVNLTAAYADPRYVFTVHAHAEGVTAISDLLLQPSAE